jgi:putative GTP pyrophosphokinase
MGSENTNQLNKSEISEKFSKIKWKYEKLGLNLIQALELFLNGGNIDTLSIDYRVKESESFLEKIERKGYGDPFEQTEDLCGIRVICFYQSDVELIEKIIEKEFIVLENQDKEELLKADQFGYRSTHFVVKIKKNWLQAPNYRGLENIKAEIQIRTIMMHAWAEIQHKLSYKKQTYIPKQFKRKFSRISAKLEEADEQFEELRDSIKNYKVDVVEKTRNELDDSQRIELNLDSLQAFLDNEFANRERSITQTMALVDELIKYDITLNDFIKSYEKVKKHLPEMEREVFEKSSDRWAQVGIARNILDLTHDRYLERTNLPDAKREVKKHWKKIIEDDYNKISIAK